MGVFSTTVIAGAAAVSLAPASTSEHPVKVPEEEDTIHPGTGDIFTSRPRITNCVILSTSESLQRHSLLPICLAHTQDIIIY